MPPCTDPLPDFTNFSYKIVTPPDRPKGIGWEKLQECERRLILYKWAEQINYPGRTPHNLPLPQHRVFLDDCLSAFLTTYEAALQFAGKQLWRYRKTPSWTLNGWLKSLPEHDLQVRGWRTLRHFAAHVEIKTARRKIEVRAEKAVEIRPKYWRVAESTLSPTWMLPELNRTALKKLDRPQLDASDLPAWNTLVGSQDAALILEHGLRQAQEILLAAEKLL